MVVSEISLVAADEIYLLVQIHDGVFLHFVCQHFFRRIYPIIKEAKNIVGD